MRLATTLTFLAGLAITMPSYAEFRQFKDYDIDDEVVHMTTIKVDAGKGEDYLEGLAQTWSATNELAKELGQIEDYGIYVSRLPESGDFNVVLIVEIKSMADFVVTQKQEEAFMKKWGERARAKSKETAKAYPELRTIVGEYILGKVEIK